MRGSGVQGLRQKGGHSRKFFLPGKSEKNFWNKQAGLKNHMDMWGELVAGKGDQ